MAEKRLEKEQGTPYGEGQRTVSGLNRRTFLKYSTGTIAGVCLGSLLGGCGGGGGSAGSDPTFPVVVFSDIHFNPFYDTSLFASLNTAGPSDWAAIFRSSGGTPSSWGMSGSHFDTNYPLLALTLSAVGQNLGASPVVIYTGDLLGHEFTDMFYTLTGASPQNPSPAAVAAMQAFADKTAAFVMQQVRSAVGNVPVMFALGNADSYGGNGPESAFLSNNAQLFYTQFLNGIVDQQTFLDTFTGGGYYSADIPSLNLVVIGLNTFIFNSSDTDTTQSAITAQFDWLDSTLASARASGEKVWLLMHLPPGANEASTTIANGQVSSAAMWWDLDPTYQTTFLQILSRYPGLITFTLGAHTHMDEYRILLPGQVLDIAGGISPVFGNDPAFKVFTFSRDSLKAIDYTSLNYDLSAMPAQFNAYYTFSTAYGMQGFLNDSLTQLYPALVTNSAKQAFYRGSYFSGHNYTVPVGVEQSPITDATWPVYWAGIGNMDEQSFINAVNSY